MTSRKRSLSAILFAWMVLFLIVFIASHSILRVGFDELEFAMAEQNNHRTEKSFLQNLKPVLNLTSTVALGQSAQLLLTSPKSQLNYYKSNLINPDFFIDNQVNYIFLYNKYNDLIASGGFDLKTSKSENLSAKMERKFQQVLNAYSNKKIKYQLTHNEDNGAIVKVDSKILFFSIHRVQASLLSKPMGTVIIAKSITPQFIADINQQLDMPISIQPLKIIQRLEQENGQKVIIAKDSDVYVEIVSPLLLSTYQTVNNYIGAPSFVLQVDLSRKLHQQNKQSTLYNLVILLIYSLIGVIAMIVIVIIFFRRMDLFTTSIERFVPRKSIDLLHKKSIIDIELGNYRQKEVSVLFTDIRNFTTISEEMTPEENFVFINKILEGLAPIISQKNGFVDKFIGDAIMAVFYDDHLHADDSIDAALMMLFKLQQVNKNYKEQGLPLPIKIGVGINTGNVMLGIVGEGKRIECTIISDTVNTASRIESTTKQYGTNLLISEYTYRKIDNFDKYHIRFVDEVLMKGKSKKIKVYEVFNTDSDDIIQQKEKSKAQYLEAWTLLQDNKKTEAKILFEQCLAICSTDVAVQYFIGLCDEQN